MVRKSQKSDASRIAEILIFAKRTCYRNIFNDDETAFKEMQVLPLALHYRDNPDCLENIYVYDDGIVKGMINLIQYEGSLEIKELYVDPFFQGQRVGKRLMEKAFSLSYEIFLWVLEKNLAAIAFYEALGFSYSGQRQIEQGTEVYVLKYFKSSL